MGNDDAALVDRIAITRLAEFHGETLSVMKDMLRCRSDNADGFSGFRPNRRPEEQDRLTGHLRFDYGPDIDLASQTVYDVITVGHVDTFILPVDTIGKNDTVEAGDENRLVFRCCLFEEIGKFRGDLSISATPCFALCMFRGRIDYVWRTDIAEAIFISSWMAISTMSARFFAICTACPIAMS